MSSPKPFHLTGRFAPVLSERTDVDLEVIGEIPLDLRGMFVRNGPNPRSGQSPAWFAGEGMLHGVRLEGGRASWYRNRWIKGDYAPNTNVMRHHGHILALVETRLPIEVNAELETVGQYNFNGSLDTTSSMTAHPRICPRTGELLFFSYGPEKPHLTYFRADASGRIVHRASIDVPAMTYMHDFAITENYVVFYVVPVLVGNWRSPNPLTWTDAFPARFGVLPRKDGANADIRWFDVEPCMISHTANAYEDENENGKKIVLDACRAPGIMKAHALYRFTFDLSSSSRTEEKQLDPRFLDFPRVHPSVVGAKHRYLYTTELGDFDQTGGFQRTRLFQHDLREGTFVTHDFKDADAMPGECILAPRGKSPVDEGGEEDAWAMTFVHYPTATELVILDTTKFAASRPVARIRMPSRVPFGLHGEWLPDG